ncbi:hypothetical protein HOH45_01950 [bacterium]|jgi:DNA-binding XRE family transcriptional regulator|nr:hypothetical protein [bacterium]
MSVHTKKQHISEDLKLVFGGEIKLYKDVPKEKLDGILAIVGEQLKEYGSLNDDDYAVDPWKKLNANITKSLGGNVKFHTSALAVKGARIREGLTQANLAEKIGMARHNLSLVETAKRPVGKKLAYKFGTFFGNDYKLFLSD